MTEVASRTPPDFFAGLSAVPRAAPGLGCGVTQSRWPAGLEAEAGHWRNTSHVASSDGKSFFGALRERRLTGRAGGHVAPLGFKGRRNESAGRGTGRFWKSTRDQNARRSPAPTCRFTGGPLETHSVPALFVDGCGGGEGGINITLSRLGTHQTMGMKQPHERRKYYPFTHARRWRRAAHSRIH